MLRRGMTAEGSTIAGHPRRRGTSIQLRSRTTHDQDTSARDGGVLSAEHGGTTGAPDLAEPPPFVALVTAIRWTTTALGLLLLSTGTVTTIDPVIGAGVLSYSLCRTLWPLNFSARSRALMAAIAAEGAVMVTAVVVTGYWNSPFVFGLAVVISAAGFAGGIPLALNAAALCLLAVALPYHLGDSVASPDFTLRWAGELMMVAILAGYVRHLGMQASAQSSIYVGQLRQLSEVNDLLVKLRHAAQTLPVSLDLGDTLDAGAKRLRELFEPTVLVIMLRDEDRWTVAKSSGARLGGQLSTSDLPEILRTAAGATATITLATLGSSTGSGLAATSTSALYVRLCARNELIGLVAVERSGAEPYSAHHVDVMETLSQQLAISCDNARWFARIGTLAAEQERGRIARDLHDRVGQSLALVGFELDRLAKNAPNAETQSQTLELREHVRGVMSELRDALYDLRTDVSEERDLPDALGEFLERVRERSGLEVHLRHAVEQRLALTVEREVWRVAQEAVLNVERHAHATCLEVDWVVREGLASLSVKDDGRGMPAHTHRKDGYGIVGMHERAEAIGASLSLESAPESGTIVRLTVATERLALRP